MDKARHSAVFVFMTALFVAAILVSNILATKQVIFFSWINTNAGYIVFPITYILSDVFSEVYGYRVSRRVSWLSFSMNLFMVITFQIALILPYPSWWHNQEATAAVLGSTPRILVASLAAFQFGNWFNDILFQKLRAKQGEKRFWFRALSSSVLGEAVDSTLFFTVAFIGSVPLITIPNMVLLGVVTKVLYEIVLLPITMLIVKAIRAYEGKEVYVQAERLGIFG
jgi:uncharacterized integral membrane protein (TIGR00697 family)